MRGSLQAYKKVSVDSQLSAASPHKIVQMLMAGAIERLIQGKAAMQQGNIPVKGERLGKALDIIISLRSCLSMEDGAISPKISINCMTLWSTKLLKRTIKMIRKCSMM